MALLVILGTLVTLGLYVIMGLAGTVQTTLIVLKVLNNMGIFQIATIEALAPDKFWGPGVVCIVCYILLVSIKYVTSNN